MSEQGELRLVVAPPIVGKPGMWRAGGRASSVVCMACDERISVDDVVEHSRSQPGIAGGGREYVLVCRDNDVCRARARHWQNELKGGDGD